MDAPQREKRRRRAPRVVFPDPDRGRKPKRIPALHFKTWEEWRACPLTWGWRMQSSGRRVRTQLWRMQASFTHARELAAYERRCHRLAAAAAQRAVADVGVVLETASEAPHV